MLLVCLNSPFCFLELFSHLFFTLHERLHLMIQYIYILNGYAYALVSIK